MGNMSLWGDIVHSQVGGFTCVPVTKEQLARQQQTIFKQYLQLPGSTRIQPQTNLQMWNCVRECVTVVDSCITLDMAAADILGSAASAGGDPHPLQFLGVDSEWEFSLNTGPQNTNSKYFTSGASLLQVATLRHTWLFDMTALGRNAKGRGDAPHTVQAKELLSAIFASPHLIKVGWAFDKSDTNMLRSSAGGRFSAGASTYPLSLPSLSPTLPLTNPSPPLLSSPLSQPLTPRRCAAC